MKNDLTKQSDQTPVRAEAHQQRVATVPPRVDVFENEAEYLVVADVPGVAKDAIDVRFEGGELRLEAHRAGTGPVTTGARALAEEYRVTDYRRAFSMPDGIDAEHIEAELANGVLKVHLPKSAAKRARRIDVRAS